MLIPLGARNLKSAGANDEASLLDPKPVWPLSTPSVLPLPSDTVFFMASSAGKFAFPQFDGFSPTSTLALEGQVSL